MVRGRNTIFNTRPMRHPNAVPSRNGRPPSRPRGDGSGASIPQPATAWCGGSLARRDRRTQEAGSQT